jgi:tetratricopeptide (TPR) repeat protein
MKTESYEKASRRCTFIIFIGITVLVFLMLIGIAGAKQSATVPDSSSNSQTMRTIDPALKYSIEKQLKEQDEALQKNPFDSEAWKFKAFDLAMLHRYDEAIIAYDQAIKVNPKDSDAWFQKGDLLLDELNRPDEAIKAYDKAIELNQKDVWNVWDSKGHALDKLGRHNEAIDAFKKAKVLDPYRSSN